MVKKLILLIKQEFAGILLNDINAAYKKNSFIAGKTSFI
jgi:hypothetical protein